MSPSRVIVNPPHTYLITDKDEAIVMAVDLRHAQEVMELDMIKKLAGTCLKKCSKCRDLSVFDTQPSLILVVIYWFIILFYISLLF